MPCGGWKSCNCKFVVKNECGAGIKINILATCNDTASKCPLDNEQSYAFWCKHHTNIMYSMKDILGEADAKPIEDPRKKNYPILIARVEEKGHRIG